MNRNTLYVVVAILAIALAVVGWRLYQEENKEGIQIEVGKGGLTVQTN
jgi:predicted negative regulator of RcsB-dependent stress response